MRITLLYVVLVLFFSLAFSGCVPSTIHANRVCLKNECIVVEVAQSPEALRRGLQFRSQLALEEGMLFIFSKNDRHSFWMKDTLIPLDIIWLDYAHRIVFIAPEVPPCRHEPCPVYTPHEEALYVLEVNAGLAQKKEWKRGDGFKFHLSNF